VGETLRLLNGVASGREPFAFVPSVIREKAAAAVTRGIDCILAAQIVEDGHPTVWGQQHDPLTLQPVAGRNYEPAALCSAESAGIVLFLMNLPKPNAKITQAIDDAIAWFRKVAIHGQTADAPARWARFYEIGSGRPIFGDRDKTIHDTVEEISRERRNGYSWYNTAPQAVLDAKKSDPARPLTPGPRPPAPGP
jgi:PelA/Pel-15E family pectate lyase